MKPALIRSLGVIALCLAFAAPGLLAPASAGPVDLDEQTVKLKNKATFEIVQGEFRSGTPAVVVREAALGERGDAFDGGLEVMVYDIGPTVSVAPPRGKATRRGADLITAPAERAGVQVSLRYHAVPKTSTLRLLVELTNTTGQAESPDWVQLESDLGSDDGTTIAGTSSGDTTLDGGDRWVVTSDGTPTGDAVVSHVLAGRGARAAPYNSSFYEGDTVGTAYFGLSVPAHATRYLMFFTRLDKSTSAAVEAMVPFGRGHLLKRLTAGMSKKVQRAVLNWDL